VPQRKVEKDGGSVLLHGFRVEHQRDDPPSPQPSQAESESTQETPPLLFDIAARKRPPASPRPSSAPQPSPPLLASSPSLAPQSLPPPPPPASPRTVIQSANPEPQLAKQPASSSKPTPTRAGTPVAVAALPQAQALFRGMCLYNLNVPKSDTRMVRSPPSAHLLICSSAHSDENVANRNVSSGGRTLTRPFRDARRFPSTRV
jgi:hypothetical protein